MWYGPGASASDDAALACAAVSLARKVSADPNAQSRMRKRALAYYSSGAQVPNVVVTVKHVVSLSTLPRRQWLQKVVGNVRWTGRRADDGVHSPVFRMVGSLIKANMPDVGDVADCKSLGSS